MTDSSRGYQQFFAELKRRHVFRVAAIYGAVAFGVLQVAEPLATALGLSDSFLSLVVGLLLLGFPVALVLAWAFEVTPEGVQKAGPAAPGEIEEIIAQPASKRWPAGLLALAGAGLLFGGWWMGQRSSAPEINLSVPEAQASEFQKLAVLPFENVRGDDDSEVLAVGLQEGLAQTFRGLATLRVTSTGSVREYRSSDKGDIEIAEELVTDYLVRGSVLRAGQGIQVNVSLIDGMTGETLWGDTFDREITAENLFEIKASIAREVAQQVATRLSPEDLAVLSEGPLSRNLAALNAYNRARQKFFSPGPGDEWSDVVDWGERAVALDSGFVAAWALLAQVKSIQARNGSADPATALEAVLRTEELAPHTADAIGARAWYTYYAEGKFAEALSMMREAERMAPSDGNLIAGTAYLHRRLGQLDEAISTFTRAIALDPRNAGLLNEYSNTLRTLGRYEAADAAIERALQVRPDNPRARADKVMLTLIRTADVNTASRLAFELALSPSELLEAQILVRLALYGGNLDEASALADRIPEQSTAIDQLSRLFYRAWPRSLKGEGTEVIGDSILATDLAIDTGDAGLARVFRTAIEAWGQTFTGDHLGAVSSMDESRRLMDSRGDHWSSISFTTEAIRQRAMLGRVEEALDLLDEVADSPFISSTELLLDPSYDALRDDPRFAAIVERRRAFEAQAALDAEAARPWLP